MPALYPFSWAISVVHRLTGKYPRASKIVWEITDIDDEKAARFLMHNDVMWYWLRDLVHLIDERIQFRGTEEYYLTDVASLSPLLRRKGRARLADRLDSVRNRAKIREQAKGEAPG